MQVPNEWLNGLLGAAIALGVAWFRGWLVIPGISPAGEKPKVLYQAIPSPPPSPVYEAKISIPHKITVEPQ